MRTYSERSPSGRTRFQLLFLVMLCLPQDVYAVEEAEAQSAPLLGSDLSFGGFVDTYFSDDFNNFEDRERLYLTQPLANDEGNINLSYLDLKLNSDIIRARGAVQYGTSVDANYAAEREKGIRYLQEAVIGVQPLDKLWIDAGVYFSHIGLESFISRDNAAYTRSLVSEFSPYYQSGVRISYEFASDLSAQLHLLNGWQNITHYDGRFAVGTQLAVGPSSGTQFFYNTFVGDESDQSRVLNDFVLKFPVTEKLTGSLVGDVGYQDTPGGQENWWYGWLAVADYKLMENLGFVGRIEQYIDRGNIIVGTPEGTDFDPLGLSLGINLALLENLLWRSEVRLFNAGANIFPQGESNFASTDAFVVTSLSYSF